MRDIIQLACGECKRRNYSTTKNKKKTTERLEFSKFCRFCRKHTAHKETQMRKWEVQRSKLASKFEVELTLHFELRTLNFL